LPESESIKNDSPEKKEASPQLAGEGGKGRVEGEKGGYGRSEG